ncbi:MAG: heme exporter protein CcmB [Chloroflexi bacterium]|nr:heme exporter protein CcmB [Chloroflexota bacterium]
MATVVWKDVVAELRTKERFSAMFTFAIVVVVVFNFAFELRDMDKSAVGAGVLWVAIAFAGVLGLNRSFAQEKEGGCLEGLMLIPVDRSVVYVGKMIGNLLSMLVTEAVILPVFMVLLDVQVFQPLLLLTIVLGTVGFVAMGTLLSAMSVNTKTREVLLPILLFPLAVPVLIAAVKASGIVMGGGSQEGLWSWLQLLGVYDVIFLVLSALTFEYVLEE